MFTIQDLSTVNHALRNGKEVIIRPLYSDDDEIVGAEMLIQNHDPYASASEERFVLA